MRASVTTADGRRTLHMERLLEHPVHEVWRAITDPTQLSLWWPMKTDALPLEVGAPLRFYDADDNPSLGAVHEVEPERVLAFSDDAGAHRMRFRLEEEAGGCRLHFTHEFDAAQVPAQHAVGWHMTFDALEAVLAQRPLPRWPPSPTLRRRYDDLLAD